MTIVARRQEAIDAMLGVLNDVGGGHRDNFNVSYEAAELALDMVLRALNHGPDGFDLYACPECGYTGISGVSGGVGPWPGDGKVRCPSHRCEYRTVMEQHGRLVPALTLAAKHGTGD